MMFNIEQITYETTVRSYATHDYQSMYVLHTSISVAEAESLYGGDRLYGTLSITPEEFNPYVIIIEKNHLIDDLDVSIHIKTKYKWGLTIPQYLEFSEKMKL